MRAAVVVPVKNEAHGLVELISALCRQARPDDRIIVVDAGSTDATPDILRGLAVDEPRLSVVEASGAMPGRARNLAVALARDARIIAQIDGGNLPEPGWLEALRAPLERGDADYVTGAVDVAPVLAFFGRRVVDLGAIYGAGLFRGPVLRAGELDPEGLGRTAGGAAGGAGVAYLRHVWEDAGGFPEWPRFGADPLFVEKIRRRGTRFAFAPQARILWQLGPGLARVVERHFRHQFSRFRGAERFALSALLRSCLSPCVFLFFSGAGFFFSWLWAGAGVALAAETIRHSRKTLTTLDFRLSGGTELSRDIPAMARFFVPGLEMLAFLARVAATVRGTVYVVTSREKKEQARRVAEYLESACPCSTAD